MRPPGVAVGITVLGVCGVLAAQMLVPPSPPVPPPPLPPAAPVSQELPPLPVPLTTLALVLNEVKRQPPRPGWMASQQPWTPAMVGQVGALVQMRDRAEEVTRDWEEGHSLIWTTPGKGATYVALSVARFGSGKGAQGYFSFALDLQRKRDEQLASGCVGTIRLLECRPRGVQLAGVEEAQCFDKQLQIGSQSAFTLTSLLLRQNRQVIEVQWHGLPPDWLWVQQVVNQLEPAGQATRSEGFTMPPTR